MIFYFDGTSSLHYESGVYHDLDYLDVVYDSINYDLNEYFLIEIGGDKL